MLLLSFHYLKLTLCKIPWFHLISWRGHFAERYSFLIVSGDSPKTSTKFPHQEIRWNYGILLSVTLELLHNYKKSINVNLHMKPDPNYVGFFTGKKYNKPFSTINQKLKRNPNLSCCIIKKPIRYDFHIVMTPFPEIANTIIIGQVKAKINRLSVKRYG